MYRYKNESYDLESSRANQTESNFSMSSTVTGYDVKMPPISQPLISIYRGERLKIDYFSSKKWDANIIMDFFCGKESNTTISMCTKCERSPHSNICSFIIEMIEEKYDWKNDIKFKSSYEFYNKKKITIFLTDQEIEYRLMSKFSTLGVILLENRNFLLIKDKLLLMRIIKNYIKHTIYYGEEKRLTLENDYYFWFLVGIYYHVGVPKYFNDLESLPKDTVGVHEPMMFWMLDAVMKKLHSCTRDNIRKISYNTLEYCQFFYPKECKSLSSYYEINLQEIFSEWTSEGMMGYMGIEFIGFYIKCIMKQGFEYMQKTIMSYFEKRTVKLEKEEVVHFQQEQDIQQKQHQHQHPHYLSLNNNININSSSLIKNDENKRNKKEQILKILIDSNEEWPGIFFNTNVYDLKG